MSYLLDKKIHRKKISKIILGVVVLVFLFFLKNIIWKGFSSVSEIIFHPVLVLGRGVENKIQDVGAYFVSKSYLYDQNQKLQAEVSFDDARMANYNSIVLDDASLKEILGRANPKTNMVLAAILSKPNQSPYDTLLIDAGTAQAIKTGDTVFALGNAPIGQIANVYPNSAKVVLFSNPGETTEAVISSSNTIPSANGTISSAVGSNVLVYVVGRGGGNFEIVMPKNFVLKEGDQAVLPGINSYVLAIVQKIISDPRNAFNKALLTSPVNIQNLKFLEVEQ